MQNVIESFILVQGGTNDSNKWLFAKANKKIPTERVYNNWFGGSGMTIRWLVRGIPSIFSTHHRRV